MLTFHPLSFHDKYRIDKYSAEENSRSADFNFGNIFLWDSRYKQLVSDYEGRLIILCCAYPHPIFPFPIGAGELAPAIEAMREYTKANSFPFVIRGLEYRHKIALESIYPGRFSFTEDRDYSDYLYSAEKLASLSGRHLHGKRNHIHRFTSEHSWYFSELHSFLFPECLTLLQEWDEQSNSLNSSLSGEQNAILRAFDNFDALGMLGGALFADGNLVAFTFGEKISSDTFDVHIEKAHAKTEGAYTVINQEFSKLVLSKYPEIAYINREDDMGLENLRKSKQSYYPDLMVVKYTAIWRE